MTPWAAEQVSPWTRAATNVSEQLMRMPYMRAMGQQRAAMGQYYQAHAGQEEAAANEATARTGLLDEQTKRLAAKGAQVEQLQNNVAQAQQDMANGLTDSPAIRASATAMATLTGENPANVKNFGLAVSQMMARRGDMRTAAGLVNPEGVYKTDADNARIMNTPMNVPANALAIDKTTGQPVALGNALVHSGEELFTPNQNGAAGSYPTSPTVSGAALPAKADPAIVNAAEHLIMGGATADPSLTGTNAAAGMSMLQALVRKNNGVVPMANAPTVAPASTNAAPAGGTIVPNAAALAAPPGAIEHLRNNPQFADQFDQKYGQGASAKVFGASSMIP